MSAATRPWLVVNPLPTTLAHYEKALRLQVGGPLLDAPAARPDIEVGGGSRARKVAGGLRALLGLLRAASDRRPAVVLWPALGLADLALWRALGRSRRLVVVHDAEPLRDQHGYGRIGTLLGRWGSRGRRVEVVAHTRLAAQALERQGIRVRRVLPHPVLRDAAVSRRSPGARLRVVVLGQHKTARDLELLTQVAAAAPDDWDLHVAGRGWPDVPGWQVDSRFLSEEEITRAFTDADVVLLPYATYFQSGIATRACELGVPVAGRRHEFLESLYGPDWPGLAESDDAADVVAAIARCRGLEATGAEAAAGAATVAWRDALATEPAGSAPAVAGGSSW